MSATVRWRIRPAHETDYDGICELFETPEEQFLIHPAAPYPFTVTELRRIAAQRRELTVVQGPEGVIAFANLYDIVPRRHAFVGNLVVQRQWRGHGVGRHLAKHMLGLVFETYDLPQARLSVFSHNAPALKLYRGLGFRPYASEPRQDPAGARVQLLHLSLPRGDYNP